MHVVTKIFKMYSFFKSIDKNIQNKKIIKMRTANQYILTLTEKMKRQQMDKSPL